MQLAVLILNAGSSSLKFSLFSLGNRSDLDRVMYGEIDALNDQPKFSVKNDRHEKLWEQTLSSKENSLLANQSLALSNLLSWLQEHAKDYQICAAGHRVVHGGENFISPIVVDENVLTQLEKFIPLAPLHQPYNIAGIKALSEQTPTLFQVACFDTAFHVTQSAVAQAYALPEGISSIPIKRYGFHGLSYEYIAQIMPNYLGSELAEGKIIVAHLGYGASMCALLNRRSVATTMGLTALEGLPMGTRCGSIDPGVILYLLQEGISLHEITDLLYKRSGLLGISGRSGDVRFLLQDEHPDSRKALDIFIYRIQRELGSLVAALGGLNSLVFTGGIGEHAASIRTRICENLSWLGLKIDEENNRKHNLKISHADSRVPILVIPTNEELIIAQYTLRLWQRDHKSR